MKKRKIGLVVAIASIVILSLIGCNNAPAPPLLSNNPSVEATATQNIPTSTPSAPAQIPSISMQLLSMEDSYVKIHVEYPVIAGMSDTALQTTVNDMVSADANARATQLHDDAEGAFGDPYFVNYTLNSQVSIHHNDGTLVSISIRYQFYTGGAHEGTDGVFINALNTQPGKRFLISDLFTDAAEGKSRINDAISTEIGADDSYDFSSISDDQWFYISGDDLVVVFPAYTIGPGAMGEPEFSIPIASLSDILIPELSQ